MPLDLFDRRLRRVVHPSTVVQRDEAVSQHASSKPGNPAGMLRAHDLRAADILSLQRTVGNRAVQRMLAQHQAGAPAAAPVVQRAPRGRIQRADNWTKFKHFASKQGKGFRGDQQWWLDEMNPSHNTGIGKVTKPVVAAPFAAMQMGFSGVGRGLATLGAGAYYGARGLGSGAMSAGRSIGRGAQSLGRSIKAAYNKDRNPHGYNRDRLPTKGKTALEIGKPAAALGVSGATLGSAESASTAAGFPAGAGMLGLITAADAALTWRNGAKMAEAARQRQDFAGEKVGTRKANQGKWGLMGGIATAAQGGLNLGTAIDVGSQGLMSVHDIASATNYVSSGLGIAGAATGIAGGAITAGQGMWKTGKALSKLYKLSKSTPMLSPDGERWRAHIKDRQKTKAELNALKTIGGALGIAAGALIIASNPVGWALGVAAAATVGGLAAYKFYTKWKKSRRKQQFKHEVRDEMEGDGMPELEDIDDEAPVQGQDEAGLQDADPTRVDQAKRKKATDLANRVAQKASKSGKVAGEIRAALVPQPNPLKPNSMVTALDDCLEKNQFTPSELRQSYAKGYPFPQFILRDHDARVMLSVLNITRQQVESDSGQELIEKKLSVSDSL